MKNNYLGLFNEQYGKAMSKIGSDKASSSRFEFNLFVSCKQVGIPKEDIPILWMLKFNKEISSQNLEKLDEAYVWKPSFMPVATKGDNQQNSAKKKSEVLAFVKAFLLSQGSFRWNKFKGIHEIKFKNEDKWKPLDDRIINSFWAALVSSDNYIHIDQLRLLLNSEFCAEFNPFAEYFNSLPPYDGVDYIREFSKTMEVDGDPEEFANSWKIFITGIVACCLYNIPNHTIFVLVGGQGIGKTTILRRLVPEELLNYYFEGQINPDSKDSLRIMSTVMVANNDEMANYNKSDYESFKSLATSKEQIIRLPYAKAPEIFPRIASFVASINHTDFLRDLSGSRRFICFWVKDIDLNKKIDMDLVYAQAYHNYLNGGKYFFSKEDLPEIEKRNEAFTFKSEVEQCITTYLIRPEIGERDLLYLNSSQIVSLFFEKKLLSKRDDVIIQNFGRTMKKYGFETKKVKNLNSYVIKFSPAYLEFVANGNTMDSYISNSPNVNKSVAEDMELYNFTYTGQTVELPKSDTDHKVEPIKPLDETPTPPKIADESEPNGFDFSKLD